MPPLKDLGRVLKVSALLMIGVGLFSFANAAFSAVAQNEKIVSVCQILQNPKTFDGVEVQVFAEVQSGQGLWLAGGDCEYHVVIGKMRFTDLIALTDPQDIRVSLHRVPYVRDRASRDRLRSALRKAALSGLVVRAVFVGVFETRNPLTTLVDPRNPSMPFGFGDQNVAPGQLLVREVRGVSVEPPRTPAK